MWHERNELPARGAPGPPDPLKRPHFQALPRIIYSLEGPLKRTATQRQPRQQPVVRSHHLFFGWPQKAQKTQKEAFFAIFVPSVANSRRSNRRSVFDPFKSHSDYLVRTYCSCVTFQLRPGGMSGRRSARSRYGFDFTAHLRSVKAIRNAATCALKVARRTLIILPSPLFPAS